MSGQTSDYKNLNLTGILEKDMYLCDYIASEDTVLAEFSCENAKDLKGLVSGQSKLRSIFLRAAMEQRQHILKIYADLDNKARQFHMFVETVFNDYKNLCLKYKVEQLSFLRMELFHPLEMQHKAEDWEVNRSVSIVKNYLEEYIEEGLCYDLQLIAENCTKASALHEINVDTEKCAKCCYECKYSL